MSAEYERQLEESMAQYRKSRDAMGDLQAQMAEVSATVVAPRQVVSVTVGSGGKVKEIVFPGNTYKNLTRSELAKTILETIEAARTEMLDKSADLLAPLLPPGLDPRLFVRGETDIANIMPDDLQGAAPNLPFPSGLEFS